MSCFITKKSLIRYINDLQRREEKLSNIGKDIGEATSSGHETWHDNAQYDIAINEFKIHNRLLEEAYRDIKDVNVMTYPNTVGNLVILGSRVIFLRDNIKFDFKIVGFGDGNIEKSRLYYQTPLAKALLGHRVGDEFDAVVNNKISSFIIKDVLPIKDADLI